MPDVRAILDKVLPPAPPPPPLPALPRPYANDDTPSHSFRARDVKCIDTVINDEGKTWTFHYYDGSQYTTHDPYEAESLCREVYHPKPGHGHNTSNSYLVKSKQKDQDRCPTCMLKESVCICGDTYCSKCQRPLSYCQCY